MARDRHLANLWQETILEPSHPLARRRISPPPTVLNTIDVLVLLDLLGHMSPRLHSYYRETDWLFDNMKSADERLQQLKLVEVEPGEFNWFNSMRLPKGMIGDDHVPVSLAFSYHQVAGADPAVLGQGRVSAAHHLEPIPVCLA